MDWVEMACRLGQVTDFFNVYIHFLEVFGFGYVLHTFFEFRPNSKKIASVTL